MSRSNHVYDKAKFHDSTVEELGLSPDYAENHTVFFLRWLIEQKLISNLLKKEMADHLDAFTAGSITIHELYQKLDRSFTSQMLSPTGNAFASHYFDFIKGDYMDDYADVLQESLPSGWFIQYTEDNYQKLRGKIGERYAEWQKSRRP